jgi:ubiquinone biosynthesis protein
VKPLNLFNHAVRAKEIFGVLARHGFADLLDQLDLPAGIRQRLVAHPHPNRSTWERIRLVLEDLGPTFVKFGQLMSMRPDVLPAPLILELRKLQNEVRPVPFAEIRPVLGAELPADPSVIFSEFDETPVASGSLAQVYFARLRASDGEAIGRPVAVKVQRPNIARIVQTDLDLAGWLIGQLHHRMAALQPYDLPAAFAEVRQGMQRELDFANESRNQQYFNTLNPYPDRVFAPAVVNELTTGRLIVMERIDGAPVGRAPLPPEQAHALAAIGARSLMQQVLVAGFFHADPHSGNVMVTNDGRLCFLDWGLAGHLTRRLRYALADFWIAAVDQDAEQVVQIAANLAPSDVLIDLRVMEKEVTLALREELNFAIGRQHLGRAMLKLLFIFGRHGIPLSRDYSLMAKAVLAIEEVGRTLDPGFDLREQAGPVLRELQRERVGPKTVVRQARDFLRASIAVLQDLPGELHRLVRRIEHDNLTLNLEHRGLGKLQDALATSANRIALGVIIGSLIIGSSLIVTARIPPLVHGYPVLGITGYLLSAALGFYVIWDIIRHGRHK